MGEISKALLEKLQQLPAAQLSEVENYVEFLANKERRRQAFETLLANAPALEAAGFAPLTDEEIDAEIAAVRAERRGAAE